MDILNFKDKGNSIGNKDMEEQVEKKNEKEDENGGEEVREEEKGTTNLTKMFLIGHSDLSV